MISKLYGKWLEWWSKYICEQLCAVSHWRNDGVIQPALQRQRKHSSDTSSTRNALYFYGCSTGITHAQGYSVQCYGIL